MANIKFSQFTQKTTIGNVDFLVGYTGAQNIQVDPVDLLSGYSQGTGAAGQVTFFSATSTITGDNDFYWDNTNRRLGIKIRRQGIGGAIEDEVVPLGVVYSHEHIVGGHIGDNEPVDLNETKKLIMTFNNVYSSWRSKDVAYQVLVGDELTQDDVHQIKMSADVVDVAFEDNVDEDNEGTESSSIIPSLILKDTSDITSFNYNQYWNSCKEIFRW